jgi:hypothetical protein
MVVFLSKTKRIEGILLVSEMKDIGKRRKALLEDELFKAVREVYKEPLSVYDDTVKKNVFCLEYSDRELITIMLAHSLRQRGLDGLCSKSQKIPNAIELYVELRNIAQNPPDKKDLIYIVGRNVLRKYSFEEIKERYLAILR